MQPFHMTVMQIQQVLRRSSPQLSIDGEWGPLSSRAYHTAPRTISQLADRVAADNDLSISFLDAQANLPGAPGWVTLSQLVGAVSRALTGLDPSLTTEELGQLVTASVIRMEALTHYGRVFLRSLLVTNTSHAAGPFQFEMAEWNQVWSEYPAARKFMNVYSSRDQYVSQTEAGVPGSPGSLIGSAYAFAGELLDIRKALREHGIPVTPQTVYTLHNQGVYGGVEYLLGKREIAYRQSRAAVDTLHVALQQVNNSRSINV